ncbi:hypothetical protein OH720_31410 [Pseudomonas sp. WJP1]|uniref:hypothetical protein n=1 Tax=Pseudomonas sp. WJP1 TaxID=2986947 RepID=UPI00234AA2E5|nr:hypothetical protein [Pseudomonas sp. WJP1]WCM51384.1 hypothetical protein OH720_31410 [Pseudomonas sp. WJP1]
MKQANIDDAFKKRADDRAAKGDAKSRVMGYVKGRLNDKAFEYAAVDLFSVQNSWYMSFSNSGPGIINVFIKIPEEAFNTNEFKLNNPRDLLRFITAEKLWDLSQGKMIDLKKDDDNKVTGKFDATVFTGVGDDQELVPVVGEISIFTPKQK